MARERIDAIDQALRHAVLREEFEQLYNRSVEQGGLNAEYLTADETGIVMVYLENVLLRISAHDLERVGLAPQPANLN